ncbi:alaserpin-like isoform X2 [Pectinophora gossypiella]|uniref:alaserpin-like isoform X2 n=1 Tax=Pectinophora gossypiella TaxID=13191 RepID=UPI00214F6005|nr:alaserpin-like isoform X2 [Pectinophora gossypiella]
MKLFITILALASMAIAEDESSDKLLIAGNNRLTAKMFAEVVKTKPNESIVLSAFSVLTPLALLSQAAVGPSHDELLRAIGMPSDETTKQVFGQVNKKLRSVKGVELKQANRLYIPKSYKLNEDYEAIARDVFDSEVKNVDFSKNVETAKEINTWVESQTNNRIKDLVKARSLTSDTKVVLVNAIYFKGQWKEKFNPNDTVDRDFHVTKDKTIKVPTMYKKANFLYSECKDLDAKFLRLPYVGDEASMLIILPNQVDGLAALEEKLKDPEAITRATSDMFEREVEVRLPKFKIETEINLKDVLKAIDVNMLFDFTKAKLNKLLKGENDLFVSDAIQKAFIEVNEEGAEAAAANEFIAVAAAPLLPVRPLIFTVDRPFYFGIDILGRKIFTGTNWFTKNK